MGRFDPSITLPAGDWHTKAVGSITDEDVFEDFVSSLLVHVGPHIDEDHVVVPEELSFSVEDLQPERFEEDIVRAESEVVNNPMGFTTKLHAQARYDDVTQVRVGALDGPGLNAPTHGPSLGRTIDVGVGIGIDAQITEFLIEADAYVAVKPT